MMNLSTIEILATILIVIVLIKIGVVIINPKIWLNLIAKIYTIPALISVVGFVLSILVLYFIINSGTSILEVLAVCLFVALLMMTALANYSNEFIAWISDQDILEIARKLWLYSAVWLFLLIWGMYTLLTV